MSYQQIARESKEDSMILWIRNTEMNVRLGAELASTSRKNYYFHVSIYLQRFYCL